MASLFLPRSSSLFAIRSMARPKLPNRFVFSSLCKPELLLKFFHFRVTSQHGSSVSFGGPHLNNFESANWCGGVGRQRRLLTTRCQATQWTREQSPYETLELSNGATEEEVKVAYRRMAKKYHPDVYDGKTELEEGETAESRFIQIQAAYELLMDPEEKGLYDRENRQNPMKASKAWVEWVMKKKKAFEQRGDLAVTAWAEQQQRELSLKARNLSKQKTDPEEERRQMERQKQASIQTFETTLKRHSLVLKKRDILRKQAEESAKKRLVQELLAAEGFEIEDETS